jgi:glycosyltransferase 2 family protein
VKIRVIVIALFGVALAVYLVRYVGFAAVLSAAIALGWHGFALLCLYGLALFPVLGAGWYVLLPRPPRRYLGVTIWARAVRDAAGEVLPFSQLGGIVLGVRAAALHHMPVPLASGSMIVDVTAEMLAQIAYAAFGVAILILRSAHGGGASLRTTGLIAGIVIAAAGAAVLLILQLQGRRLTERVAAQVLPRSAGAATKALGGVLDSIYRSPARVALSATIHLAGWIAGAVGAWIAFRLIGVGAHLSAVIAIESIVSAARSVAVIVPNALGVQEAAYAALAPLFGIGAEFGLAVSLIKRARDVAIGIPVLLLWQGVEGRRALADRPG